jgi:hypothetical protein
MRSIAAILALTILLFNWFGYRLLISVIETRADQQLEAQFDENKYDESQLISIKIPVRYLPYFSNSTSFERVDGQIEIKGIQYKYVKRRIYNDSLEMLCIPNHMAMKLQTAQNEFFKFSNDLQQEKKSGQYPHAAKYLSIDYYTPPIHFGIVGPHFIFEKKSLRYSPAITSCYFPTREQPPDIY